LEGDAAAGSEQSGRRRVDRSVEAALRHSWHVRAVPDRAQRIARVHPAHQLGRGPCGRTCDGRDARDLRMSLRRLMIIAGLCFALGALTDAALTWRLHDVEPPAPFEGGRHQPAPVIRGNGEVPAVGTIGSAAVTDAVRDLRKRDLELPVYGVKPRD